MLTCPYLTLVAAITGALVLISLGWLANGATVYMQLQQLEKHGEPYLRLFDSVQARLQNRPASVFPVGAITHVHVYPRTLIFCAGPFELARLNLPVWQARQVITRCRRILPVAGVCHHSS